MGERIVEMHSFLKRGLAKQNNNNKKQCKLKMNAVLRKPNYANPPTFHLAPISQHWLIFKVRERSYWGYTLKSQLGITGLDWNQTHIFKKPPGQKEWNPEPGWSPDSGPFLDGEEFRLNRTAQQRIRTKIKWGAFYLDVAYVPTYSTSR